MNKDFDQWNGRKKAIQSNLPVRNLFFHEREIWWCAIGINLGVEADGKNNYFERPVLVVRKFNREMFWGIPLTSREKTGPFYERINYQAGYSWAMLTQIRIWSSKRLFRKIGVIEEVDFLKIQGLLCGFVSTTYGDNKRTPSRGGGSRRPKPLMNSF